jgi:hypothetical protein
MNVSRQGSLQERDRSVDAPDGASGDREGYCTIERAVRFFCCLTEEYDAQRKMRGRGLEVARLQPLRALDEGALDLGIGLLSSNRASATGGRMTWR